MQSSKSIWKIPELPFVYTPLPQPTNGGGLPDGLPFSIAVDETTGRILQETQSMVSHALEKAYKRGSMFTGQMDDDGIGRSYTDDFLKFIQTAETVPDLNGKKVLEIGCGTGYLLYRIKGLGGQVTGVEPGTFGEGKYESRGVSIIREFFPCDQITEHFDVIIIYAVLEHVEDPAGFLQMLEKFLNENGKLIIAVPNCEPYIAAGDISMLIHEHWSYFTQTSLTNTIKSAGLEPILVTQETFGGFLYAAVINKPSGRPRKKMANVAKQKELVVQFVEKAKTATAKLVAFVDQVGEQKQSLGIYVAARAINSLATGSAALQHCRFFDDNALLRGTYFPGIPIAIESREDLIHSPVDQILVMSHSFGDQIITQLKPIVPETTRFTAIKELLDANAAQAK